jgi:hypothetical protein
MIIPKFPVKFTRIPWEIQGLLHAFHWFKGKIAGNNSGHHNVYINI